MDEEIDDRFAGIDIDSLLSRVERRTPVFGHKRALYEAPEFVRRFSGEETVMEGQSLCLECKVVGFPAPSLRWFKDDEEILDHPRIHVDSDGLGGYCLVIDKVNKGDEAAYRCRAENVEGSSSCFFFLSVKSKPKSKKREQKSAPKRSVSFPPMFATIVEKVEEEEKLAKEQDTLPPSPLTQFYYALTLKSRQSWPSFVGDWAFENAHDESDENEEANDEEARPCISNGDLMEGDRDLNSSLLRTATRNRLRRRQKDGEEEAKRRKLDEEESKSKEKGERERKEDLEEEMERERKRLEEEESEKRKREEAVRLRRKMRMERMERELKEEEEQMKEKERKRLDEEKQRKERKEEERKRMEEEKERKRKEKEEEERKEKERQEQMKRKETEKQEQLKRKLEEERKEKERQAEKRKKEEERKEKERQVEKKRKEEEERKETERQAEKKRKEEEARKGKENQEKIKREEEIKREDEKRRKEKEERKRQEEEKVALENKRKENEKKHQDAQKRNILEEKAANMKTKSTVNDTTKQTLPYDESLKGNKSNEKLTKPKSLWEIRLEKKKAEEKEVKNTQPRQPNILQKFVKHLDTTQEPCSFRKTQPNVLVPASKPKCLAWGSSVHDKLAAFSTPGSKGAKTPEYPGSKSVSGTSKDTMPGVPKGTSSQPVSKAAEGASSVSKENEYPEKGSSINTIQTKVATKESLADGTASSITSKRDVDKNLQPAHPKSGETKHADIPTLPVVEKPLPSQTKMAVSLKTSTSEHVEEKCSTERNKEKAELPSKSKGVTTHKTVTRSPDSYVNKEDEKRSSKDKFESKDTLNVTVGVKTHDRGVSKVQSQEKQQTNITKLFDKEKDKLLEHQRKQREVLLLKQKEEEIRKKQQREREEQEERLKQFKKEQIRKEQLKRQYEQEMKRRSDREKERKRKVEEEEKLRHQKLLEETERKRQEVAARAEQEKEEFQVKVHKRDYSFMELRKSLESHNIGSTVLLDAEEHKYWDEILEKHDYSISDIRKSFIEQPEPPHDQRPRIRQRRNSIEGDSSLQRLKRSGSITDLRESYTNSLERPKKQSEEKKRQKDEEFLKRASSITDLKMHFSLDVNSSSPSISSCSTPRSPLSPCRFEDAVVIQRTKTVTMGLHTPHKHESSSLVTQATQAMSATSKFSRANRAHPELTKLAVSVADKRASVHEVFAHGQSSSKPITIQELSKKRMSLQVTDSFGVSREVPVYRRVTGWADDIGKSEKRSLTPNTRQRGRSDSGQRVDEDGSSDASPRIRPFVYNSIMTIARKFSRKD